MQQAPPRTSQGTEGGMNSLTLYDIESTLAQTSREGMLSLMEDAEIH